MKSVRPSAPGYGCAGAQCGARSRFALKHLFHPLVHRLACIRRTEPCAQSESELMDAEQPVGDAFRDLGTSLRKGTNGRCRSFRRKRTFAVGPRQDVTQDSRSLPRSAPASILRLVRTLSQANAPTATVFWNELYPARLESCTDCKQGSRMRGLSIFDTSDRSGGHLSIRSQVSYSPPQCRPRHPNLVC